MDMNTNMAMAGDFFNPGPFMPHGGCYLWTQSLIALHAISDGLIVLSYYSIPFLLLYFMRRRKDVDWKLQWVLGCFALFVLACGTTHLMEIWNIWHANYWLSGLSKAFTALVSMLTLVLFIKLLPHALALPSVADLQKARDELEVRVRERTAKLEENEALLLESQRIASLGSYVTDFVIGRWSSSEVLDQIFGIGPAYDRSVAGWAVLIHPDDRAMMVDYLEQEVIGRRRPFDKEYRIIRHNDQAERWVNGLGKLEFDAQGRPLKMVGTIQDITERRRAEEANARLAAIVESSDDAIIGKTLDGIITSWNKGAEKVFGYSSSEMLGTSILKLISAERHQEENEILAKIHRGESVRHFETVRLTKDGRLINISVTASPIRDATGRIIGASKVARDITERKRAEAELKLFRMLVDQANDSFLVIDPETGRLLDVNEQGYQARGYSREEFLALRVFDIDPTLRPDDFRKVNEELRTKSVWTLQGVNRRKDGSTFPVEVNLKYVKLERDYIVADVRDITERLLAEKSHARLATAVEQAAETIVITDTDGNILYANPAFEKSTGYTRAEAFGRNPRFLKSGKQDAGFYRQMWEVLGRGEVWHGHFINKHKEGRLYEEEVTISPVRDAAGKIVNYVAVKRDVTREMQLETQFRQTQKLEAIGTLASGVAHDFNNILAVISIQASLLKSGGGLSADQLKFADEINSTVDRAAALTRQLLLFSRREALQLRDLDWSEAVTHTIKMLRRILGENIEVLLNLAVEPMFIHADAGMMEQVLMNLAVNARDAMPKGGRMVIATAAVEFDAFAAAQSAQARPGSFVCLSVADNGCGISPEVLPKIFEPFFTTKDIGKGSGLGLATVFGIVQQHHGWINVYSEPGQGTTFKVYLPRLVGMNDQIIGQKMPAPIPTGKETILLVEDDPSLRATVRITLVRLGYRVLEAPTGAKALELWQEHGDEIHLLLTDLMMPDGMNGKELAQRLFKKRPKLKVIYMSGYSTDILDKDFPVQIGINFLAKPFQMAELAQIIRDSLDKPALPKKIKHG